MRRNLRIRKTQTASGATAVQVVCYQDKRRIIVKHIGSAHDEKTLAALWSEAEDYVHANDVQPSLFDRSELQ